MVVVSISLGRFVKIEIWLGKSVLMFSDLIGLSEGSSVLKGSSLGTVESIFLTISSPDFFNLTIIIITAIIIAINKEDIINNNFLWFFKNDLRQFSLFCIGSFDILVWDSLINVLLVWVRIWLSFSLTLV